VIFIRGKNICRLIIDGLRVLEETFSVNANTWQVTEPLYIGGVAPGKAVKNFQVNQTAIISPICLCTARAKAAYRDESKEKYILSMLRSSQLSSRDSKAPTELNYQ